MADNRYVIAVDMDGTLLNSKKEISFLTKRYLQKISKKGHIVVLASGRPPRSMLGYYNELGLKTPIIFYNGGLCYNPNDKNFPKKEIVFPNEIVRDLDEQFAPYISNSMCETHDTIFVDKEDKFLDRFFWYKNMNVTTGKIGEILSINPYTYILRTVENMEQSPVLLDVMKKYPDMCIRFWSGSPYFELFFNETSKAARLLEIAEYYNIPKERIIAFGDADNDIQMLEAAGWSVAMKNGKPAVKNAAKLVSVKDNDHNGIYYTLKKYFKL